MPEITPCQLHQVLRDVSVKHHVVIAPEHYFLKVISICSAYVVAGGILLGPIGLVAGMFIPTTCFIHITFAKAAIANRLP